MCSSTRSSLLRRTLFLGMVVTLLALLAPAVAQESEDCLGCHTDSELTGTRDGTEISVF